MIYGSSASEINNLTAPSLKGSIKSAFQAVGSWPIFHLLVDVVTFLCKLIVVMKDATFGRRQSLKTEFREFYEHDAQYDASRTKLMQGEA